MNTIMTNPKCSVNITTSRNRVKTYGSNIYLRDGQKFELEIHNPQTFKVLAKIKMNGQYISTTGLVLNPGQKVYLERFLDRDESFIFTTYDVENTEVNKTAIANNGNVEVEFYSVYVPQSWQTYQTYPTFTYVSNPNNIYCNYSSHDVIGQNSSIHMYGSLFSSSLNDEPKGSMETGRVEKGQSTGQNFSQSNDSFNSWAFDTASVKILPFSAKPIEVSEIRSYCTECGTRIKKQTWKFCPNCGSKK